VAGLGAIRPWANEGFRYGHMDGQPRLDAVSAENHE